MTTNLLIYVALFKAGNQSCYLVTVVLLCFSLLPIFKNAFVLHFPSGRIIPAIGGPTHSSIFFTGPWSCPATSACVCWLIDWRLRFTWIWLVILDPTDFNWFTLYPCAMSFFQRLCSALFPTVSWSFPDPHPDPQGCLYNLLERQPENSWPWEGNTL